MTTEIWQDNRLANQNKIQFLVGNCQIPLIKLGSKLTGAGLVTTSIEVLCYLSIEVLCVHVHIAAVTTCDNILVLLEACPAYESLQSQTHNHPANQKTTKSKNIKRKLPLGKSNMTDDDISTCGNSSEIHHVSEEGA